MASFSIRFQRMAGFLRAMAGSTLALGALSASVVLSGGDAKALQCEFILNGLGLSNCDYGPQWNGAAGNPIPPGPTPPSLSGDPYSPEYETNTPIANQIYYYPTDKVILFDNGPTGTGQGPNPDGVVYWDWQDANSNGTFAAPADADVDFWEVTVDYFGIDGTQNANSTLDYYVGIKNAYPDQFFSRVVLASPVGTGLTVETSIYSVIGSAPSALLGTLTNSGTLFLAPDSFKELFISDRVTTNGVTATNYAYANAFYQTPGPLPVLGAGAAFGFSRKLRQRIKASRVA